MELTHFVLVTGPQAGAAAVLDTAQALRDAGALVTQPMADALPDSAPPGLQDWALSLLPAIPRSPAPIVVGFGAGAVLAAWLAPQVGAVGLILTDCDLPPDSGTTGPGWPEGKGPADWQGDQLDLPPRDDMPTGYLKLSPGFDAAAAAARARGWPVEEIEGTRLQAAMLGTETAGALMAVAGAFD
ncbi:hypothetical protein [Pseudooceanicola onchidii]|uniref:hypothetical protein n=1 Tax=Pseudooceanicola onchidii TaxID=2562279 RepID=UPI0010AAB87D|nr:hypothetical protein [Pseudooceanicola onchidii]